MSFEDQVPKNCTIAYQLNADLKAAEAADDPVRGQIIALTVAVVNLENLVRNVLGSGGA